MVFQYNIFVAYLSLSKERHTIIIFCNAIIFTIFIIAFTIITIIIIVMMLQVDIFNGLSNDLLAREGLVAIGESSIIAICLPFLKFKIL